VEKDMGADTASGHGHVFVALGSSKYPALVPFIFDVDFYLIVFIFERGIFWTFN